MTARFVGFALNHDPPTPPAWLEAARTLIDGETPPSTSALARMLGLHPAWLARAYRQATGEGLRGTLHRRWVERAVLLLRESSLAQADIAADAGFCDQSHMIRVFRRVLGRTPSDVRADSTLLATLPYFPSI
jgi:AraC-like DNA-binding protein